ncbi:MAG: J domain-containing protein [Henriciella sp.]|nr:J domain-containing protein [Henriciella sp.]
MSKDLYKTLGVSRTASADDIRRAYKRKAKESHPDLHPDDANKAEIFKSASAAYEILSDETKRGQYDRGEIDGDGNPTGFGGQQGFGGFGRTAGGFQGDPFEEILSGMFGGGRRRPGPRKGADMRYRVEISFEDSVTGARREMMMADGRALNVSIPPGIETGRTLRLKSQGKPSNSGGPPGDALLEISVRPSKIWTRDGSDIRMTVPVPLKTALLGGQVEVNTPMGPISLKIPEGSNSGATLRLRSKGVQVPGKAGNLYARLEIQIEDPKDSGLRDWARGYGK